nr:MAG TPA: hypothetical protein [Inoviridae sp.]
MSCKPSPALSISTKFIFLNFVEIDLYFLKRS